MKKREFENSNPDPDIDILTLDAILKLYKSKMTEPELKDFQTAEKIIKSLWKNETQQDRIEDKEERRIDTIRRHLDKLMIDY